MMKSYSTLLAVVDLRCLTDYQRLTFRFLFFSDMSGNSTRQYTGHTFKIHCLHSATLRSQCVMHYSAIVICSLIGSEFGAAFVSDL